MAWLSCMHGAAPVLEAVEPVDLLLLATALVQVGRQHLDASGAQRAVDREAVERPSDLGRVAVGGGVGEFGLLEEARRRVVVVVVAALLGVARAS